MQLVREGGSVQSGLLLLRRTPETALEGHAPLLLLLFHTRLHLHAGFLTTSFDITPSTRILLSHCQRVYHCLPDVIPADSASIVIRSTSSIVLLSLFLALMLTVLLQQGHRSTCKTPEQSLAPEVQHHLQGLKAGHPLVAFNLGLSHSHTLSLSLSLVLVVMM